MNQSVKHNFFIWSVFSSICIVILGSGWHFLYVILEKSNLVAWCTPINESIWEHLKLTLYPVLIVMLILYGLHFIGAGVTVGMNPFNLSNAMLLILLRSVTYC